MFPPNISSPTRIVFGSGKLAQLGTLVAEWDVRRVLVVSDAGVVAAGHTLRGIESLQKAGLETELFDGVEENPTTAHVDAGTAMAREFQPELIVGLGGGSSMDCAKGINFIYSCGGEMQDYWGEGKATGPLLPMIAVPTTAGTGSETQSYALIADAETRVKMACGDKRATFQVAILDPELTLTQPARVTALTGIDAIAHAVETYVSKRRNPVSLDYSREAWKRLLPNFGRLLPGSKHGEPGNLEARAEMQIGACLAGLAIENSMLGAAHALANPLTATYGIAHGEAVALMLPHVIRHNGQHVGNWYEELLESTPELPLAASLSKIGPATAGLRRGGQVPGTTPTHPAAETLAQMIVQQTQQAGLAGTLRECDVQQDRLDALATDAATQWTGTFNPVAMALKDFRQLYELAF